jgi:DNA-binding MarR family transcriptional regulator
MDEAGQSAMDPIREAERQWVVHGWKKSARGMAAVTSVMRAHQILLSRVDKALVGFGITFSRYEVLMLLHFSRTGTLPMRTIGQRLQVHPTSVTNSIDRLEAVGLVERVRHPTDRRMQLVNLTDAGRELAFAATAVLNSEVFEQLGLSSTEQAALVSTLEAMRRSAGDF